MIIVVLITVIAILFVVALFYYIMIQCDNSRIVIHKQSEDSYYLLHNATYNSIDVVVLQDVYTENTIVVTKKDFNSDFIYFKEWKNNL